MKKDTRREREYAVCKIYLPYLNDSRLFCVHLQNISLTYNYGKQCTSVNVTLNDDNTVSGGPFNNTKWSFDATKNILTIGQNKLCVAREVDWEAKPRHVTIVYAGYTPAGRGNPTTYWGKKK